MPIIGIDLGTTNSLASYRTEEGSTLIPNALGNVLTPSVVGVDDNGQILVGEIARERLVTHPERTAALFKRYIGTERRYQLGEHEFSPEDLSAFVLRSLKQDAEAFLGEPIEEAVISVPAYFNDIQRKATKRAGELAGLRVERLINEPTAAAVAYGLHLEQEESQFLVFDLGGGTFDVSILDMFEGVMEVKSVAGDAFLGGEDFTDMLIARFLDKFALDGDRLDKRTMAALRKQAEQGKRLLTMQQDAKLVCTVDGETYEWSIDRGLFDHLSKPLLNRLRHPVERALKDASLSPRELNEIVLVGGATRMPLIYSFAARLFGRLPAARIHPDETVAIGAGIVAAMKERREELREVVLTDVCPYTLGTMVTVKNGEGGYDNGHFYPIIERHTVIPASRVERFYTVTEDQKTIRAEIFQGENRLTRNNIKLGQLEIPVPPGRAGEQAVDIRFTYDINGILEVEITTLSTGETHRLLIREDASGMSMEEVEKRFQELEAIKIHPRDKAENRLLLARGDRIYEESLGMARTQIAGALRRFETALNRQDEREIRKEAGTLKELLELADKQPEE